MENLQFKSLGTTVLEKRGRLFLTELPCDCYDLDWLLNMTVIVGEETIMCRGVERYAHMPPFHKGERISILAEP